jgi:hypothetical protein
MKKSSKKLRCKNGHPKIGPGRCLTCANARYKRWRQRHPDRARARNVRCLAAYRAANPEKCRADNAAWRANNREYCIQRNAEYRRKNWPRIYSERRADPNKRLGADLRAMICGAIRRSKGIKSCRSTDLLGCSIPQFRAYIEHLWIPGMSWANWGREHDCWQLDHKRPVCSFDLTDPAQQRACFHFTNY